MQKLHASEQGLLIPNALLTGLSQDVVIRRVENRLIIETEQQADARERLLSMAEKLRDAAEQLSAPSEDEIRELVDEVRAEHARRR